MVVLEFVFNMKTWGMIISGEGSDYLGGGSELEILLNLCSYWKMLKCGAILFLYELMGCDF
jgi:hypothetical protein